MNRGKILAFHGSWMSGLATLVIEDFVTKEQVSVYCENGPTVRALEGCFGNVIGNAHSVKGDGGHVGKEVYYSTDELGILNGFTPVDAASDEIIGLFNSQPEQGEKGAGA